MARHAVGRFRYLKWEDAFLKAKPYFINVDVPASAKDMPQSNISFDTGPEEKVWDMRPNQDTFNLDDHGFVIIRQGLQLDSIDPETVETQYLPSLEALLQDALGQDCEIIWFDWRVRSSEGTLKAGTKVHLDDRSVSLQPVWAVHIDQTPAAAIKRVHHHTGERAAQLLGGRVRVINIWRPYGEPVESWPLAVMDGSTVRSDKLVDVDVVRHSYIGEASYPLQHDDYRWYYIDKQTNQEVLLMKMFDSSATAKAKCCPHSSFELQNTDGLARPRQSIEARALVFTVS